MWSVSTDLPAAQQGPTCVLQLSGDARRIADEIDIAQLMGGVVADWNDGNGAVQHPGLMLLLRRLSERFGEMETETMIRTMVEFFSYRRLRAATIDEAITEFDILYSKAVGYAHLGVSPSVLSFMLLQALHIGP